MGRAYASRRCRRCAFPACVVGGRIRRGDQVVRVRQHEYMHQADLDDMAKAIEFVRDIDVIEVMRAAVAQAFAAFAAFAAAFRARPLPTLQLWMPDALPHDDDPDRCWRCDVKPGMEELDGACWRCHYELAGAGA